LFVALDSALGAATTDVTGTDNAATALIAAVDNSVRSCFLLMDSSGRTVFLYRLGQPGGEISAKSMGYIDTMTSLH
jgi:hypothetical protein